MMGVMTVARLSCKDRDGRMAHETWNDTDDHMHGRLRLLHLREGAPIRQKRTQEQTLSLTGGTASVQVRGVTADGIAVATDIKTLPIDAILDGEVL